MRRDLYEELKALNSDEKGKITAEQKRLILLFSIDQKLALMIKILRDIYEKKQ